MSGVAFAAVLFLAAAAQAADSDPDEMLRQIPGVVDLLHQPGGPIEWTVDTRPEFYKPADLQVACHILAGSGDTGQVRFVNAYMVHVGKTFREASLGHIDCKNGEVVTP